MPDFPKTTIRAGIPEHNSALEVLDIREATENLRGDSFDLKTFYDQVMSFGSPPPAFVSALLHNRPIP